MQFSMKENYSLMRVMPMLAVALATVLPHGSAQAQITQVKIDYPEPGYPDGYLGNSIAVDGNTMIAGAPYADANGIVNSGMARIYRKDSHGNWIYEGEITASDASGGGMFGRPVSISGDTVLVGADRDDSVGIDSGSAYVFTRSGGVWTQQQKLVPSHLAARDTFASGLSVSGDTIVVGAINDWEENYSGNVTVFTRSGGVWSEGQKLTAPNRDDYFFGYTVSISDDTLAVATERSVYVFTRTLGLWEQEARLIAPEGSTTSNDFGISLSLSGDTIVVGAERDDALGEIAGAAYVFTRSGVVWDNGLKFFSPDAAAGDLFGHSVSIFGNTFVVGAHHDNSRADDSGSAYVYTNSGGTWVLQEKIVASDGTESDRFGTSVAISNENLVVGAMLDDIGVYWNSGSIYAFDISPQVIFKTDGTPGATITGDLDQRVPLNSDCTPVTVNAPLTHIFSHWEVGSVNVGTTNPLTLTNVVQNATYTAIFITNPNPEARLDPLADTTLVGDMVFLPFQAYGAGKEIKYTRLFVRIPGTLSFVDTGYFETGTSGTFGYDVGNISSGVYSFAARIEDLTGYKEPSPNTAEVTVNVNLVENAPVTLKLDANDDVLSFPMTSDIDVIIHFQNALEGGEVTVSRTRPIDDIPDGLNFDRIMNEYLTIDGTGLGSNWTAGLSYNPSSAGALQGALNTVFQYEDGSLVRTFQATLNGNTISIEGITSFSDWYGGVVPVQASTSVENWWIFLE